MKEKTNHPDIVLVDLHGKKHVYKCGCSQCVGEDEQHSPPCFQPGESDGRLKFEYKGIAKEDIITVKSGERMTTDEWIVYFNGFLLVNGSDYIWFEDALFPDLFPNLKLQEGDRIALRRLECGSRYYCHVYGWNGRCWIDEGMGVLNEAAILGMSAKFG